jgi:hypothetical protein
MVTAQQPYEVEMQDLMERAGIPWGALAPEQQFVAYATEQFRPGPSRPRSAFYDVQQPLLQQYYLRQPSMPGYGGFGEFMGGGYAGQTGLRELAEQAAFMGRMPGAQFFQYVDPQPDYTGPQITAEMEARRTGMTPAQQLLYRQTYGTGAEAATNQAQLANLLALQRDGGRMYGGPMGEAITSALGELRGQLLARDPGANFLDWYLGRTEGAAGEPGGFLTA